MKDKRVHEDGDCTMQDQRGRLCTNEASLRVVKVDGTEQVVCHSCAKRLRDRIATAPDKFNPVEFRVLRSASSREQ